MNPLKLPPDEIIRTKAEKKLSEEAVLRCPVPENETDRPSACDYTHHYESPLGGITMASDGEAIIGLWFDGQKYFAASLGRKVAEKRLPVFDEAGRWLDLYFSGKDPGFTPKLKMRTTAFRKRIWEILLTIPYGQTVTYGRIAEIAAAQTGRKRMSAQAVGGAVGHNAISLIIPCHRVVGAGGSLTGYAGGLDRKARLLELEQTGLGRRACCGGSSAPQNVNDGR